MCEIKTMRITFFYQIQQHKNYITWNIQLNDSQSNYNAHMNMLNIFIIISMNNPFCFKCLRYSHILSPKSDISQSFTVIIVKCIFNTSVRFVCRSEGAVRFGQQFNVQLFRLQRMFGMQRVFRRLLHRLLVLRMLVFLPLLFVQLRLVFGHVVRQRPTPQAAANSRQNTHRAQASKTDRWPVWSSLTLSLSRTVWFIQKLRAWSFYFYYLFKLFIRFVVIFV